MGSDDHKRSKHKHRKERDDEGEKKSKKRTKHEDDTERKHRKKRKHETKDSGSRVVDDDVDDEDMWVEKNIDMEGEKVRIHNYPVSGALINSRM